MMVGLERRVSRLKELIFFLSRFLFRVALDAVDEEVVSGFVCHAIIAQRRVNSFFSK